MTEDTTPVAAGGPRAPGSSTATPPRRRAAAAAGDAGAVAALAAVLAFGAWPLLTGAAMPTWDATAFSAPAIGLVADFARGGKLLTWNPWLSGGRPDFADPAVGAASPLVVVAGLAGGPRLGGFLLYWLGSWFLGGVGVLVLGRSIGAPPWSRLVAAAGFVSCGFFTAHGQHTPFVLAYSTLPWFVWRLDRAVGRRSVPAALQSGAIWGLAGLSGYPGMVIAHGLYGGAWALGRTLFAYDHTGAPGHGAVDRRDVERWPRRLAWLAILWTVVLVTAVLVLAPVYVPFFVEGKEFTSRVAPLSRYWAVERGALTPSGLATFASPYLLRLGLEHPGKLFQGELSMLGIYLSPVVVALASASMLSAGRRRWRWWLLAMGLVALAAALGPLLPVRGWLYDLVPPTRYFRFSSLFRAYALFTVVVLALEAARAVDWLRSRRGWLALAAVSAALGALALWTAADAAARTAVRLELDGWAGWLLLAWFGPVVVGLAAAQKTTLRRAAPWALVTLTLVDAASGLRLSEPFLGTRDERQLEIWERVTSGHRAAVDRLPEGLDRAARAPWRSADNRNLAIKQATFDGYDPFRNRYHVAWSRDEHLSGWVTGSDRIWFARRALQVAEVAPPAGAGEPRLLDVPTPDLDLFARRARAVGGLLPVLHPVPGRPLHGPLLERGSIDELPAMERIPVTLLAASPETLELRVRTGTAGWLVVTDRYSPGWRATVDGRPVPIHKAAFLFRAVAVEPGTHDVRFEFRPFGYRTLVAVSWSLLLAACVVGGRVRRWRGGAAARSPWSH